MSRGRLIESVAIVLSVSGAFDSGLARCETGINTLRGIGKIKIAVEDLTADSRNEKVSEATLQNQAELALKQVGIEVTDAGSEAAQPSLLPVLYVSLSTEKAEGFRTFLLRLEFLQAVSLARDPAIKASSVTTWSTFKFGKVEERAYAGKIHTVLTILLQDFQDDFLSVNPVAWPLRDQPAVKSSPVGR
jgi:hypothetical protein